jgi:L-ribulose-5-phosphate 4-epimerase
MPIQEAGLRECVCSANKALVEHSLVVFSWGNVSGINSSRELAAIKPSGVDYASLTPADIVLVDLEGNVVDGDLKPSSDTDTHLELYRSFDSVGGIVHTHSVNATAWAQAGRGIPCYGTTHADSFHGEIPVTLPLADGLVAKDYEKNTGISITALFEERDPLEMPACLVLNHGPFAWGATPEKAVENSVILELCAEMALKTYQLNDRAERINPVLLDKHFFRKHGGSYGQ